MILNWIEVLTRNVTVVHGNIAQKVTNLFTVPTQYFKKNVFKQLACATHHSISLEVSCSFVPINLQHSVTAILCFTSYM